MNETEQRLTIAKWMGHDVSYVEFALEHFKDRDGYPDAIFTLAKVPDFTNDLNAVHSAVSKLTREQYDADDGFTYHLARIVHGPDADDVGWNFYELQEATAAQRTEALLRTLGLWTDAKEEP